MRLLIQSWRAAWHDTSLPFYYVSLAPFKYSESKGNKVELTKETLPRFREAQEAVLQVPHTGLIVTTDLATKLDDIHPPYKWEIGRRLALLALADTYKQPNVPVAPVFRRLSVKGTVATVTFTTSAPLISKDDQPLTHFTIAGADGIFVPAQARIEGQQVLVSAAQVPHPVSVRFGWDEAAQPNLFSASGLPARPFRTDQAR
jgi:sialate O-acetylesterase